MSRNRVADSTPGGCFPRVSGDEPIKAKIGVKPSISSEAGDEKGSTFDFEWQCEGEPEKLTATSTLGAGNMEDN